MLNLDRANLCDAFDAINASSLTPTAMLQQVLARIDAHNPQLGALSDVTAESALAEARAVAAHASDDALPLAGMPLAIKDIIDTPPAICCAGLEVLSDYQPQQAADVVQRLRAAGAAIVGVAATDTGAFDVRTPACRHPQAPDFVVGGSSGGSAAAVAAGFALAAIGTDTSGSIRIPAACCAIVGFKPTYGRVATRGVRPLSPSLDHVGPLARSVDDIRTVQAVLDPDYTATVGDMRERPLRIGHDAAYYADASAEVQQAMQALLQQLQAAGCEIVPVHLPHPDGPMASQWIIVSSEAAAYYLEAFADQLDALPDIIRQTLAMAEQQRGHVYVKAQQDARQRQAHITRALQSVDLALVPTLPVAGVRRDATLVDLAGQPQPVLDALIRYTCLFNESGHPVVSLPISQRNHDGLAVSAQFIGRRHADAQLLAHAARIEQWLALNLDYPLVAT